MKINRVFRSYLFLLIPLLLTNFASAFANNNDKHVSFSSNFDVSISSSSSEENIHVRFSPYQKEHRNIPVPNIVDIENIEENEEISSKENYKITADNFLASVFYKSSLLKLAYRYQQKNSVYPFSFKNTSLKLHIKFQVFII